MECKLTLQIFRFNCKTDYLPYFKKYVVCIDEEKSVHELLSLVQEDDKSVGFPAEENAAIKINGKALFTKQKLKDICEFFGKELVFEPLMQKRTTHDLIINDEDFKERFDILDAFVDSEDRKLYKNYIREHYCSDILYFEEDYIGDGLLTFAYDMIQKYPDQKLHILEAIEKYDFGIWNHINITKELFPTDCSLENRVNFLKNEIIKEGIANNKVTQSIAQSSYSL